VLPIALFRKDRSSGRRSIGPKQDGVSFESTPANGIGLRLLVITGSWNPAIEASSDVIAAAAGGRRAVIQAGHHFPQIVSDELNQVFAAFMHQREAAG
jgi:hypothetical protein